MYLLDTNVCIRILNQSSSPVLKRIAKESPSTVSLCSVVKAELIYGAYKSQQPEKTSRILEDFFLPMQSILFDDHAAREYGHIRAMLQKQGTLIGPNDLCIAAIARASGLTLVTNNTKEFSRVPGLVLDDWE